MSRIKYTSDSPIQYFVQNGSQIFDRRKNVIAFIMTGGSYTRMISSEVSG